MARPPDPAIRKRLLDLAIDYVLTHGMADLSLRPLAKALKTNARMLVYHFGSREELMRQILEGLREREDARIQAWFKKNRGGTLPEFLRWYWQRMSAPRARPALRLIFELYALALRDPEGYTGVLNDPLAYWRKLAGRADGQANAIRENSGAEATLLLAATRGLLFDLCATEDRRRVSRAMKLLAALLEQRPRNS
ncbi:MAG: TetR/AcrR family transcriptional regulator [Terriglobales bacterium]|jgi:AcrR family transcriptional regulator